MGREIRMVPPHWEHPKYEPSEVNHAWQRGAFKPLMQGYAEAAADFLTMANEKGLQEAIDYCGQAPDKNDYVPDWPDGTATWFQVYETVSEGSPVTPPFATEAELVEYLVNYGDFWSQRKGEGGFSRAAAEAFVKDKWAPSMIVDNGKITVGIESAARSHD